MKAFSHPERERQKEREREVMDAGASADTPERLLVAIETAGAEIKKGREWGENVFFFIGTSQ